jgi:CheY-like chemotaxis protein
MSGYAWLSVFRQAQEETDPSRLHERVSAAEDAIFARMQELRPRDIADAAAQTEFEELYSALGSLMRINSARLNWPLTVKEPAAPGVVDRSIRIALAEESEVMRRALTRFLQDGGGIELIGVAADVQEALRILRELQPHVLLFDLHMAVRDEVGREQLKAFRTRVALIAISMDENEEAQALAADCGAECLVDKMKLYEQLLPAIVRSAGGRSQASN